MRSAGGGKGPPGFCEGEPCPFPQGLFSVVVGRAGMDQEGALGLFPTPLPSLRPSLPKAEEPGAPNQQQHREWLPGEVPRLQRRGAWCPWGGTALPISGVTEFVPPFPGTLGGRPGAGGRWVGERANRPWRPRLISRVSGSLPSPVSLGSAHRFSQARLPPEQGPHATHCSQHSQPSCPAPLGF